MFALMICIEFLKMFRILGEYQHLVPQITSFCHPLDASPKPTQAANPRNFTSSLSLKYV